MNALRKHTRVEIVDDERAIGNGIIVTLRAGFTFDQWSDNRVAGADSVNEALLMVRQAYKTTADLTT